MDYSISARKIIVRAEMVLPCLALACVALVISDGSQLVAAAENDPPPVKLLFAGSSSTYWNDMPREVARVVDGRLADAPRTRVVADIVGRSGSDIRVYLEPGFARYEYGVARGQSFLEKVAAEKPPLVVLQVVCRFIMGDEDPKKDGSGHTAAVSTYCDAIRAAGGEPIFYEMGWGNSDREGEGRRRILALAQREQVTRFAPCSTAWARVARERPDLQLQHPKDIAHPGDLGHFLNLACFHAALCRTSPIGRLPRQFPVWPHGLSEAETEDAKATEAEKLASFRPDEYQSRMPKWMHKLMAHASQCTLDEPTATYLETVAWEVWQDVDRRLRKGGL
jgi:hypothetical protein